MRLIGSPWRRVAFIGRSTLAWHLPRASESLDMRLITLGEDGGDAAAEEARAWGAEVCLVLEPQRLGEGVVARLPGVRIGIILVPREEPGLTRRLSDFHWLTWPEEPVPAGLAALPWLQTLPPPVDTRRFEDGPRLQRTGLLVPEWAAPADSVLQRLRELAPVELLPGGMEPSALLARLEDAGVLVYASREPLGRSDALPLLALARGLLLIADTPFPADWSVEPEDEFLVRGGEALLREVDALARRPGSFQAVRVRAWQKAREAFDASASYQRLLHDASLLGDVEHHLARLARAD
jgi:hypothetical protein